LYGPNFWDAVDLQNILISTEMGAAGTWEFRSLNKIAFLFSSLLTNERVKIFRSK